jgi:hypothetical protein
MPNQKPRQGPTDRREDIGTAIVAETFGASRRTPKPGRRPADTSWKTKPLLGEARGKKRPLDTDPDRM